MPLRTLRDVNVALYLALGEPAWYRGVGVGTAKVLVVLFERAELPAGRLEPELPPSPWGEEGWTLQALRRFDLPEGPPSPGEDACQRSCSCGRGRN